ncbi:hypothetical protein PSYMO_18798, partial [Pseudomonas amygdali pv. mori str. 301020]
MLLRHLVGLKGVNRAGTCHAGQYDTRTDRSHRSHR